MKVLFLSDYFSTWDIGGASRVLAEQIRGLNEKGHQTLLISGYPGQPNKENNSFRWIRVKYKSPLYLLRLAWHIRHQINTYKPDVVHVHQPLIGWLFTFLGPAFQPKIYHFHSYWFEEKVSHSDGSLLDKFALRIKRDVEKVTLSKMDAFIVLSDYSKRRLEESVSGKAIELIPGSIHTEDWSRQRTGNGHYKFLSVRRFDPRMGLEVLIEAFARLVQEHDQCTLTLVGRGREEEKLKSLTFRLGVEKNINFRGNVSDKELVDALLEHDCMVIPSQELEGFGMVVIEALASGLPVLASDTGGLAGFKKYHEVVKTIEKVDIENLNIGLKWAMNHFNRSQSLEEKCKKIARENFDTHVMVDSLTSCYRDQLNGTT